MASASPTQRQVRRSAMKLALVTVAIAGVLLPCPAAAVPLERREDVAAAAAARDDPFEVLDAQDWVNPDLMTWADYKYPPGTNWSNPTRKGSVRNFNIALIAVDYDDRPFVVTQPVNSTIFGNPQPQVSGLARSAVPAYYRDLLNKPQDLNHQHTLHEYWMEDSQGRYGVDLTSFGPYKLPSLSYQYGIDSGFNPGACPASKRCNVDLRTDAIGAWKAAVGNATASSYELVFILSAGQDESATWQEFGEMKFKGPQDVPASFGPPGGAQSNSAKTRYVDWTSWASASTIWPNAGGGSSTQGESSGMAVYAHELSHLLKIGDNYNNPYGVPLRRSYTGPWSMMSRGSFNGPGGPHSRWKIPAVQGGSQGSLHTMRDKTQLGLISNASVLSLSREALAKSGPVVARLTARSVDAGPTGLMGMRVALDGKGGDRSPACNTNTQVTCDGGGWHKYDVEVIDRMGSDSFTPDSGVMISKTRNTDATTPFQWTIDANPQDIKLVDFTRPNGSVAMITMGDYRQLLDALFHAGTRSGSAFEYIDEPNRLHFYILNRYQSSTGVVSYDAGVRSLDGPNTTSTTADSGLLLSKRGVSVMPGFFRPDLTFTTRPTKKGVTCEFKLFNTGSYVAPAAEDGVQHPQDVSAFAQSDVYRLSAKVEGKGWKVELPNALAVAPFGGSTTVRVAVLAEKDAALSTIVKLTAVSETDPTKTSTGWCVAVRY